ncbi:ureidoglycolate lyase [Marinobacter fonticola]|uniref:ureidoglycolate lyase n=1 Tax=Marinobacter fonticola TaxID=2603215 RepID=UPI0011E856B8|nr:ureidoglycolate lyase [Marinobacter fonticola]
MSTPRIIESQPLTREAFAPFGDVICTEGAASFPINAGRTERFHALAAVETLGQGADAIISIFRGQPLEPLIVELMERHPQGSQAFMPLGEVAYWVVVAPAGAFDPALIQVFRAGPGQGVNYHAGTWHAPLLPIGRDADFLVVDRRGPGDNCDTVNLDPPVQLA